MLEHFMNIARKMAEERRNAGRTYTAKSLLSSISPAISCAI
jgi:hypothetical protein